MADTFLCNSCGVNWSDGEFKPDCPECGGGALERSCLLCDGKCGSIWKRALLDSWDFKEAHWVGGCILPKEEQHKIITNKLKR